MNRLLILVAISLVGCGDSPQAEAAKRDQSPSPATTSEAPANDKDPGGTDAVSDLKAKKGV